MRKLFFTVALAMLAHAANAQRYYSYNSQYYDTEVSIEGGLSLGLMNAFTDVGGRKGKGKPFIKDLNFKNFRPSVGVYAAANFSDMVYLRLEGTFGKVLADDKALEKVKATTFGRYERNLSFRTKINDFMLAAEIHPLQFKLYDNGTPDFSPYVLLGIGVFSFNPQANLNGVWHDLQPLSTEGQGFNAYPSRKPYSLTQLNIPLGIGVRYDISATLNARFELVHRILRTDYLDDVSEIKYINRTLFSSNLLPGQAVLANQLYDRRRELNPGGVFANEQRGDPTDKDAFFTIQFKIGYTFREKKWR
jgi:hypothetical protein